MSAKQSERTTQWQDGKVCQAAPDRLDHDPPSVPCQRQGERTLRERMLERKHNLLGRDDFEQEASVHHAGPIRHLGLRMVLL